jgi:hypothetical protein
VLPAPISMMPPLWIVVVPATMPPLNTSSVPPLATVVSLVVPLESTSRTVLPMMV